MFSELVEQMLGGSDRLGDPAARTFELEALDGVHPNIKAAILARAQGVSSKELAELLGMTPDQAQHLMTEAAHALQGALPEDWANHFGLRFPGLWGQMRED